MRKILTNTRPIKENLSVYRQFRFQIFGRDGLRSLYAKNDADLVNKASWGWDAARITLVPFTYNNRNIKCLPYRGRDLVPYGNHFIFPFFPCYVLISVFCIPSLTYCISVLFSFSRSAEFGAF